MAIVDTDPDPKDPASVMVYDVTVLPLVVHAIMMYPSILNPYNSTHVTLYNNYGNCVYVITSLKRVPIVQLPFQTTDIFNDNEDDNIVNVKMMTATATTTMIKSRIR